MHEQDNVSAFGVKQFGRFFCVYLVQSLHAHLSHSFRVSYRQRGQMIGQIYGASGNLPVEFLSGQSTVTPHVISHSCSADLRWPTLRVARFASTGLDMTLQRSGFSANGFCDSCKPPYCGAVPKRSPRRHSTPHATLVGAGRRRPRFRRTAPNITRRAIAGCANGYALPCNRPRVALSGLAVRPAAHRAGAHWRRGNIRVALFPQ